MQNVNITANNVDMNRVILRAMLSTVVLLALTYALLVGLMVWNIVERKNLEKEMQTLSTDVGNLELEYLALSGSIDIELGHAMGFKETPANFATKRSLGSRELVSNEI
ncbi:MAG: hypothetical protein WCT29_00755 [Candidatus Paceibacterota bacterium]